MAKSKSPATNGRAAWAIAKFAGRKPIEVRGFCVALNVIPGELRDRLAAAQVGQSVESAEHAGVGGTISNISSLRTRARADATNALHKQFTERIRACSAFQEYVRLRHASLPHEEVVELIEEQLRQLEMRESETLASGDAKHMSDRLAQLKSEQNELDAKLTAARAKVDVLSGPLQERRLAASNEIAVIGAHVAGEAIESARAARDDSLRRLESVFSDAFDQALRHEFQFQASLSCTTTELGRTADVLEKVAEEVISELDLAEGNAKKPAKSASR